jgi:LPXTG-motif cell wall-anchored protein
MVFPKDYELAYGYEYQVKFYVQPSDLAYDYYFEHINEETKYPNVGDDGTDHGNNKPQTSSGKPGFYSNGPSSTSYVINGKSNSLDFRKPVVQVHFTNAWEIYKVNQDGEYLDGAEFNLVEQVEEGAQATTYTGTSQTVENANGLVVWNDTVATGKTYKLIEEAAPSGYVTSEDRWIVTISDENVPTVRTVIPGGDVEGTEYLVEPIRDGKVITYRFTFLNKKAYVLPNTGGNGIYKTTLAGIAMMVMAVFMYYMDRRKRRAVR